MMVLRARRHGRRRRHRHQHVEAKFEIENPGSRLNLGPKKWPASRLSDLNHPIYSGGLLTFAYGVSLSQEWRGGGGGRGGSGKVVWLAVREYADDGETAEARRKLWRRHRVDRGFGEDTESEKRCRDETT
jgi:hypothetical protein